MIRILLMGLLLPLSLLAADFSAEQRLQDFDQLVTWIRDDYGPLTLKKQMLKFDFEGVTKTYRERAALAQTKQEFQNLLFFYVSEFHDSHFQLAAPSGASAKTGFTVDLVEGKVLVDTINPKNLTPEKFPFAKGDEVLLVDGRPALEIARELSRFVNAAYERTALRMGVYALTGRKANRFPLPSGSAAFTIRDHRTQEVKTVTLPWMIDPGLPFAKLNKIRRPIGVADQCSETSRIKPPAGAHVVEGVAFTAFSFPTEKRQVGFLRIPHDFPTDDKGNEIGQARADQYEKVIEEFERTTVGVIIDQDFNCGGSILYVNKLFSLFADQAFEPQKFTFRASQGQLTGLSNHLAKFQPSDEGYAEFQSVIDSIRTARDRGLEMSPSVPVRGVMEMKLAMPGGNLIQPNRVRYTKPVVMLINEMSGSGGDLLPSLMQDYRRATLFGVRTMGAGGHLWDDPHLELPNSKIVVNLTRSLMLRRDGSPIENLGVLPDVSYEITMQDYLGGYQDYLQAAVQALRSQ